MGGRISGEAPWRRYRIVNQVASPAAGSDWSVAVPAGRIWRITSIVAKLVTSATVATRNPYLVVSDGTTNAVRVLPYASQAASLTGLYSWLTECSSTVVGNDQQNDIPELTLTAGWTIGTLTSGLAAGDQWSDIALFVLETLYRPGDIDISEVPELVVQIAPGMGGA